MTEDKINYNQKTDFLFEVIKRYDHYIGTSNFKTGLMMSFLATVILGLTIRMMLVTPPQDLPNCAYYLTATVVVATILVSLFAVFQLFRVIFPNTANQTSQKSLIFFGDVSTCANGAEEYFSKISNSKQDELLNDIATQTYNVAGIVAEKFRLLQIAVNLIKYGVLPLLATSLILLVFIKVQ